MARALPVAAEVAEALSVVGVGVGVGRTAAVVAVVVVVAAVSFPRGGRFSAEPAVVAVPFRYREASQRPRST